MGRLLKYSTVLALAVVIGGYIVLGPSDEDNVLGPAQREAPAHVEPGLPLTPATREEEELEYVVAKRVASLEGWRAFLTAHPNGANAQAARAEVEKRLSEEKASAEGTTPAPAPADNELGHELSQRLASLASSTQSASAKAEQLLASKAPASSNLGGSSDASPNSKAASDPPLAVLTRSGDAVPPRDAAAVSHDESQDAKAVAQPMRTDAPPAGTDAVAGTQLSALAPDEICQRDEARLAQLRSAPSLDEVARFGNELGCRRLRPQVLSLMENLAPTHAQESSTATPPGPPGESATESRTLPPASADVASLATPDTCKRDEERLARLGSNPSGEEALRFVKELGCEKLLPQLQRLLNSPDLDASAPVASSSPSNSLLDPVCASEREALDRLRTEPSAEAAGFFWRDLKCEGLRPQVRLLMESLNVTPDSVGSAAAADEPKAPAAPPYTPIAAGPDSATCQRESAELNHVRATPDFGDAKRFASALTCSALKPQVARLLESFGQ